MTMTLEPYLRELAAARRALSAAIQGEEATWSDATFRRIRERHLEPLSGVIERFEADVSATSAVVSAALRRLDDRS